ncbi:MAG TPA: ACT domain-containing protein [Bacillota bacterium]|nr:ACT domain-containing protein [Bacillota bacterium]
MKLQLLDERFGVCRLAPDEVLGSWAMNGKFCSVTRTADELSVVCLEERIPENVRSERGWRCIQVVGPLDFSLVGILAKLSSILAEASVSIFAISTFDTDYILLKESNLDGAVQALREAGYEI